MTLKSSPEPRAARVTIVIACYNQAHFLREALDSAAHQTHPPAEILVIDDGSTDDTAVVAARCGEARCIRQDNRGVAAARNAGLAVSTGDYVIFLDADDRLLPNAIADGLAALGAHPNCAFAYGHVRLIDSQGSSLGMPEQNGLPDDPYLTILHHNFIWTTGAVLYRRSVFDSVGGFEPRVNGSEDFELHARILAQFPICCTNAVVVEYRRHGTNATADFGSMLKSAVNARRLHRSFVANSPRHALALKRGTRVVQDYYGNKLAHLLAAKFRQHHWYDALPGTVALLRYHSGGFLRFAVASLRHQLGGR